MAAGLAVPESFEGSKHLVFFHRDADNFMLVHEDNLSVFEDMTFEDKNWLYLTTISAPTKEGLDSLFEHVQNTYRQFWKEQDDKRSTGTRT
ncbi:hypothetical protein HC928_02305 [bacterium]|nr:hypothetical protein [bacterium]